MSKVQLVAISQDLQQTGLDKQSGVLVREFPNNYEVREQLDYLLAFRRVSPDDNRTPGFRKISVEHLMDAYASEIIADQLIRGDFPNIEGILERLNLPDN